MFSSSRPSHVEICVHLVAFGVSTVDYVLILSQAALTEIVFSHFDYID